MLGRLGPVLVVMALVACGDDGATAMVDSGGGDTGMPPADTGSADTGSADTGAADTGSADTGSADTGAPDAGTTDAGMVDGGAVDAGASGAPTIHSVSWEPVGACSMFNSSDMRITVDATDAETPGDLTYSGMVTSCSGTIVGAVSDVSCPQAGTYDGTVTVTDGDGNSAMMVFSFGPCETGSAP